jgi:hypothetical protein
MNYAKPAAKGKKAMPSFMAGSPKSAKKTAPAKGKKQAPMAAGKSKNKFVPFKKGM